MISVARPGFAAALLLIAYLASAQTPTPPPGPTTDTAVIDTDGTAHITRVVPLPSLLAPETAKAYQKAGTDAPNMDPDLARRRIGINAWQTAAGKRSQAVYPVKITESKIAGIAVHIVDPLPEAKVGPVEGPGSDGGSFVNDPLHYSALPGQAKVGSRVQPPASPIHNDRVLLCVHGGGFDSDTGSYSESIPIANLTRSRVVSVLYRLSPENTYPAALDDAIAVYKELLKTYSPKHIAIYGTSAGAMLTGEIAAQIKHLGLSQPGALGIFSGLGDYAATGDSGALFTLTGFTGPHAVPQPGPPPTTLPGYVGKTDPHDPVLSPTVGDLHGLPPTLFLTSSRDLLLSGTAAMERAWRRDGVPTQMTVFDGLPHAFWLNVELAESREAFAIMASFFNEQLGR